MKSGNAAHRIQLEKTYSNVDQRMDFASVVQNWTPDFRYSIILLDLVDHKYLFRYEYVNIGSPGRCHDAYVYRQSGLADMAEEPLFQAPTATII
ncbi:hypothetical protein HPB49_003814 [Dermacentor silvarum]|uniref:Uncharacterized protein n=1 Tax=Dermacentor silvarum TaxID=543639 RepID=A0ACB8DTN6_DERSI|nr:hypothetical protein HPB49_003814 [Dermacentor silvarum]